MARKRKEEAVEAAVYFKRFERKAPGKATVVSQSARNTRAQVVAALLVDSLANPQEMLITQRALPKKVSGRWEFPGGKVEADELPQEALHRELREELGITVTLGEELRRCESLGNEGWPITKGKSMRLWFAQISDGTPRLLENQYAMQWVKFYDEQGEINWGMLDIAWLDSDIPIVKELLHRFR